MKRNTNKFTKPKTIALMKTDTITWDINCNPQNLGNDEPFFVEISSNENFNLVKKSIAPTSGDQDNTVHLYVYCVPEADAIEHDCDVNSGVKVDSNGHDLFVHLFDSLTEKKPIKVVKSKTKVTDPIEGKELN